MGKTGSVLRHGLRLRREGEGKYIDVVVCTVRTWRQLLFCANRFVPPRLTDDGQKFEGATDLEVSENDGSICRHAL